MSWGCGGVWAAHRSPCFFYTMRALSLAFFYLKLNHMQRARVPCCLQILTTLNSAVVEWYEHRTTHPLFVFKRRRKKLSSNYKEANEADSLPQTPWARLGNENVGLVSSVGQLCSVRQDVSSLVLLGCEKILVVYPHSNNPCLTKNAFFSHPIRA